MSNLSDKEIDRLSREAADSYEPDSSPLSWNRLEQMLTEQMPERPPDGFRFGRVSPYIWGPAAIFIAGISFYLIKNKNYSPHSTQTTQSVSKSPSAASGDAIATAPSPLPVAAGTDKDKKTASSDPGQSSAEAAANGPNHIAGSNPDLKTGAAEKKDVRGLATMTAGEKSREPVSVAPSRDGNNISGTGSSTTSASAHKNNVGKAGIAGEGTETASGLSTTGAAVAGAATTSVVHDAMTHSLPPLAGSAARPGQIRGNDSLLNMANPASTIVPHKSMRINRSLNIGFAFGPDYTDAGGISNNQFGNNVGITLGYYLTSRLSVNTGIFYSNKFYWSPGHGPGSPRRLSYTPLTSFANALAAPTYQYVNGSANLYEFPLTLRYDFAKSGKSKFFANTGLSSYFMINQTNIYFFHSGGRPAALKVTDNSQQNYWFGIGDLSAGIETDMGKGFSFQAEPFLKIPLKKMGIENVSLTGYGFLLSFRYTPVLSKTKK